jgi:hypothetical protein
MYCACCLKTEASEVEVDYSTAVAGEADETPEAVECY